MDIFEHEQKTYEEAVRRAEEIRGGAVCGYDDFAGLTRDYGRLLKHLRKVTKHADLAAIHLIENNMDLIGKVHYDALTGIYNRRFFDGALQQNIRMLSRSNSAIGVMMIDIDRFKQYNDSYGHLPGDKCLKVIAEIIKDCVNREDDYAARFGGEEFVVVLPHVSEKGVHAAAMKILERVRERSIPHKSSDVAPFVTVSIGCTIVKARHTHKAADYVDRADRALYMAKQKGRNKYVFLRYKEANK
jgi:diguanylate cyclase (GGDEF)-like protein